MGEMETLQRQCEKLIKQRDQVNHKLTEAAELIGKLEGVLESVKEVNDEECYFDHHGYCQAHNLEKDCHVARASELLEEIVKWRSES